MRKWVYSYKTSDGLRHEGEMAAASKDAVYSELRRKGIRAIRVDERIVPVVRRGFGGLRKRDWLLLLSCLGMVCVISVCALLRMSASVVPVPQNGNVTSVTQFDALRLGDGSSEAYSNLVSRAEKVRESFRRAMDLVDYPLLSNYALIQRTSDLTEFRDEISRARNEIDAVRAEIRKVYAELYSDIPAECGDEQFEAQGFYGVIMDDIDAFDERISSEEYALDLLDANRSHWSVRKGRLVWDDESLAAEFRMFRPENVAATSRWRRDFGPVVTSDVVEVRFDKTVQNSPLRDSRKNVILRSKSSEK